MNVPTDLVTVYRSADSDADQDAELVLDKLTTAGFHPEVVDDDTPGVVEGSWEVRVPAAEAPDADAFLRSKTVEDLERGDESHELDLTTVAATEGALSEMEADSLKSLLDANGIEAVIIGNSTLPNLGFEVRVPRSDLGRAKMVIADAQSAGPEGAEEAEAETEGQAAPEA